jgi:hypothetical protein
MPQKALVDPNLDFLIRYLADAKKQAFKNRTNNQPVPWFRPPLRERDEDLQTPNNKRDANLRTPPDERDYVWDGSLQTAEALIDIHKAFNTDRAEEALIEAFTPGDPGNSSDGIVLSLQIDYAAQAERAFRARNTQTFPRSLAHYSTREKGHGQDSGALVGQAIEYFTQVIKQGSEASGGSI